jgi:hypothetical protein
MFVSFMALRFFHPLEGLGLLLVKFRNSERMHQNLSANAFFLRDSPNPARVTALGSLFIEMS